MNKPWSKLQKELYLIRATGLNFQIHCSKYRMNSRWGSTDLPRYWITVSTGENKEILWDYPKDFIGLNHPKRAEWYPHNTDISEISNLIREYIDTPKEELLIKQFEKDYWGLINILRAADKRIGNRRLSLLKSKTKNIAARKILKLRMNNVNHKEKQI